MRIGIGAAICKTLVKHGVIVIGCARNKDRIDQVAQECQTAGYHGKLHSFQCDLNNENEIESMFKWIKANHGGVDICISNAGFGNDMKLLDITGEAMKEMLNTNVVALVLCSKNAIKSMEERGVNDGHILHINSMLGHRLKEVLHFYSATKFAVTAITEGFRRELYEKNSGIRVTSISPALVGDTNFVYRSYGQERAEQILATHPKCLQPQDVADAVLYALSAPPTAEVHDVIFAGTLAKPV